LDNNRLPNFTQRLVKLMKGKDLMINWIKTFIFLALGVFVFVVSLVSGKDKEFLINKGDVSVVKSDFGLGNSSAFVNAFLDVVSKSKSDIYIMCKAFKFASENLISGSLKQANNRNVKLHIISSSANISYFEPSLTKYYEIDNVTYPGGIVSNFIIIDTSMVLFFPNYFEEISENTKNSFFVIINGSEQIATDAYRYFKLSQSLLDTSERSKIPPKSRFWPYELLPKTSSTKPATLSNKSSAYLSQSQASLFAPDRDSILSTLTSIINVTKRPPTYVYLSASDFTTNAKISFHNVIISSAIRGSDIKIIIGNTAHLNKTLKSIASVAGIEKISVRICPPNYNVQDFLLTDSAFFYQSGPIIGPAFINSLGLGLSINNSALNSQIQKQFFEEWSICTDTMSNYSSIIYQ